MRTFIACVPPAEAMGRLGDVCREITRIDRSLRCEHAEKLHFTIEFLGDKDEAWIGTCRAALAPIADSSAPFRVAIRSVGFFPGRAHPRIIWAGSRPDENRELCALASAVKRACAEIGHAPDPKPFHPHITLTRVKSPIASALVERIAAIDMEPIEFDCREITIMKSTLSARGSTYERLFTLNMGEAALRPT